MQNIKSIRNSCSSRYTHEKKWQSESFHFIIQIQQSSRNEIHLSENKKKTQIWTKKKIHSRNDQKHRAELLKWWICISHEQQLAILICSYQMIYSAFIRSFCVSYLVPSYCGSEQKKWELNTAVVAGAISFSAHFLS